MVIKKKNNNFKKKGLLFKYLNINCAQILNFNILLGHQIKKKNLKISKYFLFYFNKNVILNYYWAFLNIKKSILLTFNLFVRNHVVGFFSSHRLPNIYKYNRNALINVYYNKRWIKGLISNYQWALIKRLKKIKVKKKEITKKKKCKFKKKWFKRNLLFPQLFFVNNKKSEEFNNLVNEFRLYKIPLCATLDSDSKTKWLENILYLIPSSDDSASFSAFLFRLFILLNRNADIIKLKKFKKILTRKQKK